ncbi:hypothetical protein [Catenuloplanes atrovinosus]|uniref:Uncharacterized protein n=1 Tax=Catenuloplanes atrovinosus TaxID=137266 RepID=A0AAE3YS45_9ACTN|nr:hypothetical protein [Catenuloplanes atrovinosus]MDR7277645.1 hypothetical protein [Catenuloplanes atrovinosus]
MSAFVVSDDHIDALLTAGLHSRGLRWFWPEIDAASDRGNWTSAALQAQSEQRRRELTIDTAGRVGAVLLAENQRSVNHRYDEEELEIPYLFRPVPGTPDPVTTLRIIASYEYQACEHPGWRSSEAYAICDALRHAAIATLPGYAAAPGIVTGRDIFTASRR